MYMQHVFTFYMLEINKKTYLRPHIHPSPRETTAFPPCDPSSNAAIFAKYGFKAWFFEQSCGVGGVHGAISNK
jgi:hypothetical protein